ncbi:peptidoglycan DD-metalloendopeptidase family protein [Alkalicoccobacillus plakortidis]|uniref:Peptidoglycan DD-metalloendopeptidase family protein n=1 Tax=Alkalicoccobacillus plakortidis TaxID=444060 RepID=A0ABT0XFG4_9BACI|nr:peptidoglycan DD-metalloendopeptidase family protein [Alkalicoccobacillus plakortidis]MCM2674098.1 peptidoglycan DD-metalloendopeptidase family protein [Alkalicoccobacillus plakortidis]
MAGGAATGALVGSVFPGVGTIVGGIVGSIAGAIGGTAIGKWLGDLDWSGIGDGISESWTNGIEKTKELWSSFATWFDETVWQPVQNGASAAADWISDTWSSFTSWFDETIWSPITDGANAASDFISETWNGAYDWVTDKWSSFSTWFDEEVWTPYKDSFINVMNFWVGLWTKIEEGVKELWAPFSEWFDEVIWTPITEGVESFQTSVSENFDNAVAGAKFAWAYLSFWFDEVVWTPIKDALTTVKDYFIDEFEKGMTGIKLAWSLFSYWFDEVVWTPIKDAATSVKEYFVDEFEKGVTGIKLAWAFLSYWFDEIIWSPIKDDVEAIKTFFVDEFEKAITGIKVAWFVLSYWFDEYVWTPIVDGVTNLKTSMTEEFDDAIAGVKFAWMFISNWFDEVVWDPIADSVSDIKDSIVEAFEDAWGIVSDIWDNITGAWNAVTGWFSDTTNVGEQRTGVSTSASKKEQERQNGPHAAAYANGGIITRPHLGLVGEAGHEAIIPLSASRRSRALDLYEQTGKALGVQPYANGGLVGGSASASGSQSATVHATVGIGQVQAKGIEKEAGLYGKAFSESVAAGINGTVVSMDAWKHKNVQQPMTNVMQEAVGFGSSTVNSFSTGQNATPTNTGTHLDKQVKQPFRVIEGGASKWGTDTVTNFRAGQNGTPTGTQPYLQSQVHKPFDETKGKGNGLGTGTMTEFVSGMRSQSSQVQEAAQFLADTVEKTFKERLGIHSPSRVMAGLGEWASLGIIKGLDSVDLQRFANKQVDGLISAYTGMAPDFGSPFTMTSGFGPRKSPGGIGSTNHKGLDFAAPMGTPIPAQAPGQVTFSGWQGGYGNLVKILGADGIEYLYGHNSRNLVKKGDLVSGGQTIGLVGSTGNSTGPHVHYETRRNGQAFNPVGGGNSLFGGSGASTRSAIAQAALATGVGKDWIEPLVTMAMKESGGNARAVNNWDSNARRGTPSKGLMQTIDPTFNAHKLSGMDDIYNPVHNAAAAIKYIQSRYGDISNVPGIRSMRNGGAYRGYANGGLITNEQIARIGEGGQREWIIPEERGIRGRYLLGRAAQALGMEVYDPEDDAGHSDSFKEQAAIATGQNQQKVITSSGGISITIEMNGDQHFHTPQDEEAFLQKMERRLIDILQEDVDNGSGGAQGA